MTIDPLRAGSPRILPLRTRDAEPRRPVRSVEADEAVGPPSALAPAAPRRPVRSVETDAALGPPSAWAPAEPRAEIVKARIQADYYSQSHVRERVIESLLTFLDDE